VPIVRVDPRDGVRELTMVRWGLVPFWMKEVPKVPHINARAETVDRLPMFREAFQKRPCLIPATGFFEWEKRPDGRQPWRFTMKDEQPFAFAGLWEYARIKSEAMLSSTIIVGRPKELVAPIHDRMPVILRPADYDRWLDPDLPPEDRRSMLRPFDPNLMRATRSAARSETLKMTLRI
jgi:putative SOS response-associated peptidase YedK